ncbi:acyltransferase family protein [Virgibacillus sp. W0430]|uniref:acyltransferase family protein n=1 Tax=Virgibacillus sp. W0430 TaxID=3391580 RepID=UPI003F455FF5
MFINEVFWLRCTACLAVTLVHAIHNGYYFYPEPTIYHSGIYLLHLSVLFGVPVFVFISEFLLAQKYLTRVPKGFMKKRVKILLFPYLFMNFIYARMILDTWSVQGYIKQLFQTVFLGESALYFIIIIFQFYLLHVIFKKHLDRLQAKIIIPSAFIVNFVYLAFFNFTSAPDHPFAQYIWKTGYWLPFIGWLFYFVLGFYCGKHFEKVKDIFRYKWITVLLIVPVPVLVIMVFMTKYFLVSPSSKRVDMLVYASTILFLLMYLAQKIKKVPKLVMFISNYSFSIFLLNMFFFVLLRNVEPPAFLNILTYTILVFILTVIFCIGTAVIFNKFRLGHYIVGKVMSFKYEDTDIPSYQNTIISKNKV